MSIILSPSILAADFSVLGEQVQRAEKGGADWLHIDVMDGRFVPNISFGVPVMQPLRKISNLVFDVHLMIEYPSKYIKSFADAGADIITVHAEIPDDVGACIDMVHALGKKAGISVNPDTPVSAAEKYLPKTEMALVMSVYPGFGGQKYITDVNPKITEIRKLMGEDYYIQVDGGINTDNIKSVTDAGANVIVAGSSVFEGNIEENIRLLRRNAEK